MIDIKKILLEKAKEKLVTVVVPEADDERVVKAAEIILKEKLAKPILIGENDEKIKENIKKLNVDLKDTEIITPNNFKEKEVEKIEECFPFKDKPTVTWINIDGLQEVGIIEKIGTHFGIHPLVLEDILHTGQRPKGEDLGEYLFIVLKMIYHDESEDEIIGEQVSLILGQNYVISFQERKGDIFNPIREILSIIKYNNAQVRFSLKAFNYIKTIPEAGFVFIWNDYYFLSFKIFRVFRLPIT